MTPDALLFDLDGLLIDTEVLSKRAFEDTTSHFDIGDQLEVFLSLVGTNDQHHREQLEKKLAPLVDATEFRKHWNNRFNELLNHEPVPLLPGVMEVLEYAKTAKIKCAVATSSTPPAAEKKIADAGIRDSFPTLTCGDQVKISKPDPEIYVKAGASVNANMTRSVGLEDSANGVRAALGAGLNVIQIPNLVAPSADLLKLGHKVCDSMHEVLALLQEDKLV